MGFGTIWRMTTWTEFANLAPDLAARVSAKLTSTKHHVLATLRADGSPRVSGSEAPFVSGEIVLGSMVGAVKVADLLRDPRFALHTNPGDESMAGGDAKLSGIAIHVSDPILKRVILDELNAPEPCELFRLDLRQVVLTTVDPEADLLFVDSWTPDNGVRRWSRSTADAAAVPVPVDPAN